EPFVAAHTLVAVLEQEKDANASHTLAVAVSAIAGRIDKAQAAQTCGQAARLLAAKLKDDMDAASRNRLAQALAAVADRMEPTEARRVCCGVIRLVLSARFGEQQDRNDRNTLDGTVAML